MKTSNQIDAELSTFISDKLKSETGTRQLRAFLRDVVDRMLDHHDVGAIATALQYDGLAELLEHCQ